MPNWVAWLIVAAIALAFVVGALIGVAQERQHIIDENPVPVCTDEIADAGGICQGVPEWER